MYVFYKVPRRGTVTVPMHRSYAMYWCICHNVDISATYLPECQNTIADVLSRTFSQDHEREMNTAEHIQMLEVPNYGHLCNNPEHEVPILLLQSRTGTRSLGNAYCCKWDTHLLYAFPLIPLLARIIHTIRTDNSRVLLIAPT